MLGEDKAPEGKRVGAEVEFCWGRVGEGMPEVKGMSVISRFEGVEGSSEERGA